MQVKTLILWLLSEQPLHGYRIKRILDEASLRFWFQLEVGSIYAALASLCKQGLIVQEAVEREGKRPERTRYRITNDGRAALQDLVRDAWTDLPKLADPVNAAFAASSELDPAEIDGLMKLRQDALSARLEELDRLGPSAPAREMVERLRVLTQAEIDWIESLRHRSK